MLSRGFPFGQVIETECTLSPKAGLEYEEKIQRRALTTDSTPGGEVMNRLGVRFGRLELADECEGVFIGDVDIV